VLEEAERLGVTVHRISQGSGMMLLTADDIRRMAAIGKEKRIEVCLFVGPRAAWEGSAQSLAPDGKIFGWKHMGMDQLRYAFEDVVRGVSLGIRSVLVADEGLIWLICKAREQGYLPHDLIVKASAMLGLANPVGIRMLVEAGANTVNVASTFTLAQLAALRQVITVPIDLYVESTDSLGGFTRYYELPEIVRVAAPIYLKFGLRDAPNIYPSGQHLEAVSIQQGKERVHRASIGIEILSRFGSALVMSQPGAQGLAIPAP
jgi:hypothetical protein